MNDWYESFFTELPNEFWRRAAGPQLTAADVAFVQARLQLAPGARILDVPCGSGRHTLVRAAAGYRVTGVDISAEAIGHARRAAAAAGVDVELTVADMRHIPPTGDFDAAVCLGNSFGYLGTAGVREFIAALSGAEFALISSRPNHVGKSNRAVMSIDTSMTASIVITVPFNPMMAATGSRMFADARLRWGAEYADRPGTRSRQRTDLA